MLSSVDQKDFATVVLGALLHDLGKFFQRGRDLPFAVEGKHPQVSANFVRAFRQVFERVCDVDALATIVHHHHQGRTFGGMRPGDIANPHVRALAYLVSTADHLSSRERGEHSASYQDYHTTPLASVFQRVYGPDTGSGPSHSSFHPVSLVGPQGLHEGHFPAVFQQYGRGELEPLLKAFGKEWRGASSKLPPGDFEALLALMLDLLHRYTWCVPADTQEDFPDVSLFDHLKTTAAIAACLYQYATHHGQLNEHQVKENDAEARFCLVVGDLSGIQDYIFRITAGGDPEGKGTARRLRARSLFIQVLTEVLAHRVLHRFQLPLTNILMASGGNFYLLLPNLPETEPLLRGCF